MLAAGVTSAAVIYFVAENEDKAAMQQIYGSKTYVRELQRFGGKASVLFDEFNRWFAGLWEGRQLALTVLVLSALLSGILFLLARRTSRRPRTGTPR